MTYFEEIKSNLKEYIKLIDSISTDKESEAPDSKIGRHLHSSIKVNESADKEEPEKLKKIIEYLATESRNFGWSFPVNEKEEKCEESFWEFKKKMEKLIRGMTENERLYYFGYLEEFKNLPLHHKSTRDDILIKIFMYCK